MSPEIELDVLRYISRNSDNRISLISRHFQEKYPEYGLTTHKLMVLAWDFIARRLAYFDMEQSASSNWHLRITEKGIRYINDESDNPYNESIWYSNLMSKAEGISDVEMQYAKEAINAFANELFLSSHVMVGVASESVIYRLASTMAQCKHVEGRMSIAKAVENPRISARELFNKIRPELEKIKTKIPGSLADNMSIWLDSMFDVIRVNRNEAGHPKGCQIGREESIIVLKCFVTYMSKACRLINHLKNMDA